MLVPFYLVYPWLTVIGPPFPLDQFCPQVEELLSKLRGKSTGQSSEGLPMPESKQMPRHLDCKRTVAKCWKMMRNLEALEGFLWREIAWSMGEAATKSKDFVIFHLTCSMFNFRLFGNQITNMLARLSTFASCAGKMSFCCEVIINHHSISTPQDRSLSVGVWVAVGFGTLVRKASWIWGWPGLIWFYFIPFNGRCACFDICCFPFSGRRQLCCDDSRWCSLAVDIPV